MDKILFYESLARDLEDLQREAGIKGDISLPKVRVKGDYRLDPRHYSEILDEEARKPISRVCRREIDAFGYEF